MILFIDCYDSFSYNLTRLIESACPEPVVVCHNDQITADQLRSYLPFLHAIVLGPGPGNPHDDNDSGVVREVWDLLAESPVPLFGVCFGFQSMVLAYGGEVQKMTPPKHGQVAQIVHDGQSRLLQGIPSPFNAVRYHSLHATFDSAKVPLKSVAQSREDLVEMAAEHHSLPIFAVQFHPESVLSEYGKRMLENFWEMAKAHNETHRTIQAGSIPRSLTVEYDSLMEPQLDSRKLGFSLVVERLPKVEWLSIASYLDEFVLLKSAAAPGTWTIFGILEPNRTVHIRSKNDKIYVGPLHGNADLVYDDRGIWKVAADIMSKNMLDADLAQSINRYSLPFLGGLMGYITYEGGSQMSLNDGKSVESGMNSDVSLVYVGKSIQLNEKTGEVYAVGPHEWVRQTVRKLADLANQSVPDESRECVFLTPSVKRPSRTRYNQIIEQCFEKLMSGDSYELCLTTQCELEFPSDVRPWDIFLRLVSKNPAPYSSFMDFDDCLVATSPERFLSWNRNSCEFRPIKGTVRKSKGMTREAATEILRTPKEQGENLMIVDLIRHDLGHLLDDVETNQLMVVEEYHTVYQLVTSVEGRFNGRNSGIDVLSQSLPPGSMTGAPKKRSVEILRDLEEQSRGIYSGVHGYWSIDDRGDWSVVIRSLFQSRLNPNNVEKNRWRLGAGGAVTVLSTADGEYEEMNTKMDSVLNAFTT